MAKLDKFIKAFELAEKVLLSAPFIFLSFAIVTDVVLRKTLATSFSWLEEFSRYIFIFATFMGASIAVSSDRHPKMTALQNALGPRRALYMKLAANLFCSGLMIYVGNFAFLQVGNLIRMQTITSAMNIPLYTVYLIIPVSMCGMVVRFFLLAVKDLRAILKPGGLPADGDDPGRGRIAS
ncbi:MAG: TRAP transporter small permease [Candidatus Adiutrix sp.]|nr:TRAP transporter small permease [Candidatus Adiutrix sp.]